VSDNGKMSVSNDNESLEHLSYEEGYTRLQELLETLESGDLSLEESLQRYELGTRLIAHCAQKLEQAELRVHRWQEDGRTVRFEGWNADE
jgi:exodeoxyribonuclease VII small subunit